MHKQFEEKYPNICIPPLAEKPITGAFEEEFLKKFQFKLDLWLNKISSHPVLRESEIFVHFLKCEDFGAKWKSGKRKAEIDEFSGVQWFRTLSVPRQSLDSPTCIRERIGAFSKAVINIDNNIKLVSSALEKLMAYHGHYYKKEVLNLGKCLEDFGSILILDSLDSNNNVVVAKAIIYVGNTYKEIGDLYSQQSKQDIRALMDKINFLRGYTQQMPGIVQYEKNSLCAFEDLQKSPEKLKGSTVNGLKARREIITNVTFAEMNHYNNEKADDLCYFMKTYIQGQISFYSQITELFKKAYEEFDKITVNKKSHF